MATLTIADLDNGKRDLQTVDAVANSRAATATTRHGQQTTTLYEAIRRIGVKGDEVLSSLGFWVPVPYEEGLNVSSQRFTVIGPDGKVYAPLSAPFTTGEWDESQWYVLQNDLNDHKLLIFETKVSAQSAAATLPSGQVVDALDVQERYTVQGGGLSFRAGLKKRFVSIEDYPFLAKKTDLPEVLASKINAALDYVGETSGVVVIPEGVWVVGLEIKIPGSVTLAGNGWNSILRASPTLAANFNVVTNVGNTRTPHANPDRNINIENIQIDGNWQDRNTTTPDEDQGSCVKLATVQGFTLRRVLAVNGILHCIDVSASTYVNDGSTSSQAVGPSLWGSVVECEARNPLKDDGFTTHNSGFITIERCNSLFDREAYPSGPNPNQNGFEIDEGSFNVVVDTCLSSGFTKAFQTKGHSTTIAASNTLFKNSVAEKCAYGFEFSTGGVSGVVSPFARGGKIENCMVRDMLPGGGISNLRIVNMQGGLTAAVDGLRVANFGNGIIAIDQAPLLVSIENICFETQSTRSGTATGLIHAYATSGETTKITLKNVSSLVPQPIPLFRGSFAQTLVSENISIPTTDESVPLIFKSLNDADVIGPISGRNILAATTGGSVSGSDENSKIRSMSARGRQWEVIINSGSPEGLVIAPQGTILRTYANGRLFRKNTGGWDAFTSTGWLEIS